MALGLPLAALARVPRSTDGPQGSCCDPLIFCEGVTFILSHLSLPEFPGQVLCSEKRGGSGALSPLRLNVLASASALSSLGPRRPTSPLGW